MTEAACDLDQLRHTRRGHLRHLGDAKNLHLRLGRCGFRIFHDPVAVIDDFLLNVFIYLFEHGSIIAEREGFLPSVDLFAYRLQNEALGLSRRKTLAMSEGIYDCRLRA